MRLLPRKNKETVPEEPENHETESSLTKKLRDIMVAIDGHTKTLNNLRDNERNERERIAQDHRDLVSQYERERKALEIEVIELERRKQEALRPIVIREAELLER